MPCLVVGDPVQVMAKYEGLVDGQCQVVPQQQRTADVPFSGNDTALSQDASNASWMSLMHDEMKEMSIHTPS